MHCFPCKRVKNHPIRYRRQQRILRPEERRRFGMYAASAALGFAFLPLGATYRPSLVELVRAQIRQQEDIDEDDNGDPDSPAKNLMRQLRRIRCGEKVDTLFFRLK